MRATSSVLVSDSFGVSLARPWGSGLGVVVKVTLSQITPVKLKEAILRSVSRTRSIS